MKKTNRATLSGSQIVLIALCSFLALVLIAMIFVTAYANHYLNQLNYIPLDTTLSSEAIESIEQELTETVPSDYTGVIEHPSDITQPSVPEDQMTLIQHPDLVNFLLVGQDRRPGEGRQRSDSMIVVTVNVRTKEITLTSFMRDMYVEIPGYKANKMNAAYARGGFSMLCETLRTNFGVVIDGCVEVDFDGFSSIVNLVGGVDIKLTAAEAKHLNDIHPWGLTSGVNHLNGEQALEYSRIRKIGNDYARTERQRNVLTAIFQKCKTLSLLEMKSLLDGILPLISTTMTADDIMGYLSDLFPILSGASINTLRIPADKMYKSTYIAGAGSCLVPDLEKNCQLLIDTLLPK